MKITVYENIYPSNEPYYFEARVKTVIKNVKKVIPGFLNNFSYITKDGEQRCYSSFGCVDWVVEDD